MISLKAYTNWINKAPKNARLTYYRGYLCDPKLQPISPNDNARVFKLRTLVQKSEEGNLVNLVQKKHGDFDYEYMAVRK
jgi:hypothetical protein